MAQKLSGNQVICNCEVKGSCVGCAADMTRGYGDCSPAKREAIKIFKIISKNYRAGMKRNYGSMA